MFELPGYETLDLIGDGGFGEVWLAAQNSTGRNVAVKIAHAPIQDETLQIRFEREYKALGRLSGNPNIVDIVTAGTLADGRAYLVLEFIEGGTLWDRAQRERVKEDDLIDTGIELAKALAAAHRAGVLHRDVKPENVLLRETGEAVLSDFGLARLTDGATTSSNAVVASVAYAAPEILRGEGASIATDIYGLGVCLMTAAIRSVPFVELRDKSIQTVIQRVLTDEPEDISRLGYSSLFNDFLAELLAKDPSLRPVSADKAVERLEKLPQLRGDQDFSWSELLGAPEAVVDPTKSVTGQMEVITVDDPQDGTDENKNTSEPDETVTGRVLDGKNPDKTQSSDDTDKLISELTSPKKPKPKDTETPRSSRSIGERILEELAVGSPSKRNKEDEPPEDAELTSSRSQKGGPPENKPNDDIPPATSSVDPSIGETTSSASGKSPDSSDDQKPAFKTANDTTDDAKPVDHSGEKSEKPAGSPNKTTATPDSTMKMPAITIGQPGLSSSNTPTKSSETNPSSSEKPSSAQTKPNGKSSAVNSGVVQEPSKDTPNFLERLVELPKESEQADTSDTDKAASTKTPPQNSSPETDKSNPYKRVLVGLAALATVSVLAGVVLNVVLPSSEDEDPQPQSQPSENDDDLVLPISIDDEGLLPGTIEATTPSLDPSTPLFCQNELDASGVTSWKGTQFLAPDDTGSIEQLVARFNDEQAADDYVSAIEDSLQCDSWDALINGNIHSASASQDASPTSFGDRSADFDVMATSATDGSELVGKTYVIQTGSEVAVIGVNAKNQESFQALTTLVEQAGMASDDGN